MKNFSHGLFAAALVALATTASAQTTSPQVKTTIQPSLALTYGIDADGFVHTFAGNFVPDGMAAANGQLLSIVGNTTLFSLVGTTFGGNGVTTFGLPDLNGRAVIGTGNGAGLSPAVYGDARGTENVTLTNTQFPAGAGGSDIPVNNLQPSLNLHYIIAEQGVYPISGGGSTFSPILGQVALFAGVVAPAGWKFADGSLLSISANTALFTLLGTTYGGNGTTTFAIPDFNGRVAVGTGTGPGLTPVTLGEKFGTETTTLTNANIPAVLGGAGLPFSNLQPSLGINFLITEAGIFPSRNGSPLSSFNNGPPVLAELLMFGGNFSPGGYAFADGSLLNISSNTALFSLLGTNFGGNGTTNFALPDLRGRDVIGDNIFPNSNGLSTYAVGQQVGVESNVLSGTALPPLTGVPEPATFGYVAFFSLALIARKIFAARKSAG